MALTHTFLFARRATLWVLVLSSAFTAVPAAKARFQRIPTAYEDTAERAGHVSDLNPRTQARVENILGAQHIHRNDAPVHLSTPSLYKRAPSLLTMDLEATEEALYCARMSVGTPAKEFRVVLDTGSPDFWLMGREGHRRGRGSWYNPQLSKSHKDLRKQFHGEFMSDRVGESTEGEWYTDIVKVNDAAVPDVPLVAATSWGQSFGPESIFEADGVLGLALPPSGSKHFIKRLKDNRLIPQAVFAFRFVDPGWATIVIPEDAKSMVSLGGPDPRFYTGKITTASVTSNKFWAIQATSVVVQDQKILGPTNLIIDTGSHEICGPLRDVETLHKAIPGSEKMGEVNGLIYFRFPVDSPATITVTISGRPFKIDVDRLYVGLDDDPNFFVSGIVGSETDSRWVFGIVFLRNLYTVFILPGWLSPAQVGFASLKPHRYLDD